MTEFLRYTINNEYIFNHEYTCISVVSYLESALYSLLAIKWSFTSFIFKKKIKNFCRYIRKIFDLSACVT